MTEKEMLQRMLIDVSLLKKLITEHVKNEQRPDTTKEILTVKECAELTGLKKSTLYRLTHERKIPFFKPNGNRVFFRRADILAWLQSNRVASSDEIDRTAADHLVANRKLYGRRY